MVTLDHGLDVHPTELVNNAGQYVPEEPPR